MGEAAGPPCQRVSGRRSLGPQAHPGLFAKINVELKLRYQRVLTHLLDDAQKMVFTPHQVSLESESGETIETRDDPIGPHLGNPPRRNGDKLHAG